MQKSVIVLSPSVQDGHFKGTLNVMFVVVVFNELADDLIKN
jgi:hypothetical protein